MGAFFLTKTGDTLCREQVKDLFQKKGFSSPSEFSLGPWTLWLWPKQLVNIPNWLDCGEEGRVFAVGSPCYRGLGYHDGLRALLRDAREKSIRFEELQGSFVLIFHYDGATRLLVDELNVGAVGRTRTCWITRSSIPNSNAADSRPSMVMPAPGAVWPAMVTCPCGMTSSSAAISAYLPAGWVTVGTRVDVAHLAATPVGLTVTAGSGGLTADFTFSPTDPISGALVTFNANTSSPLTSITSFEWDFGDGAVVTKQAPDARVDHTYFTPVDATFTVRFEGGHPLATGRDRFRGGRVDCRTRAELRGDRVEVPIRGGHLAEGVLMDLQHAGKDRHADDPSVQEDQRHVEHRSGFHDSLLSEMKICEKRPSQSCCSRPQFVLPQVSWRLSNFQRGCGFSPKNAFG